MSRPKVNELRNLTIDELEQKKGSFQKDLFDLRQKRTSGQLEKPHLFKALRRQIAQINTLENEMKVKK